MKELNELEKIEFEIEREKQNLREWKRKVRILEIEIMIWMCLMIYQKCLK
jgi:hypothetical protein